MIELGFLWLGCGTLAYAISFGYFQNNPRWKEVAEEDYRTDMGMSLFVALFGPISLLIVLLQSGFAQYGLKWK